MSPKKSKHYLDDSGAHRFKNDPVGYMSILISAFVIAVMIVLNVLIFIHM
ncbi:MAG: hypothetical protein K5773_05155 [Pseudobutyrivibrio sp.]|nr:hypothetical protein [Pseudobutyrivibrio sp.]